jgi:hypothetical protein
MSAGAPNSSLTFPPLPEWPIPEAPQRHLASDPWPRWLR